MRQTNCLVSGFNSFGGHTSNPSQLAVESLPQFIVSRETHQRITLTKLVLETCCEKAWAALNNELSALDDPSAIIVLTGLAEQRKRIGLERFALNIRDYRIPDNDGHQWMNQRIDDSGPEALRTNLPLPRLAQQLGSMGFLCEISNHAGSYLCNEVYYRCLNLMQHGWQAKPVLFVHFPLPESYANLCLQESLVFERAGIPEHLPETALKIFSSALVTIIKFACFTAMNSNLDSPGGIKT